MNLNQEIPVAHAHAEHSPSTINRLWLGALILLSLGAIEAVAGLWSNSLALLSDAAHMLSDVLALLLAAFATWLKHRPATMRHSFGLDRSEVLSALLNALFNIILVIPIITEAIHRWQNPSPVKPDVVVVVGGLMLLATMSVFWLLSVDKASLNVRGALVHLLGDILGSAAAIVSGLVIWMTGWYLIDPILSIFICLLILGSTYQVLKESIAVLMQGVPKEVDWKEVKESLMSIPGVLGVTHLHIWSLTSGRLVLTGHLQVASMVQWENILQQSYNVLAKKHKIKHITLQPFLEEQTKEDLQETCYVDK